MINKYKTKRDEGFTIIEVLIVLAIAGLIILIVFLAVPALQRNSRNTQRKNDVSAIASAAQNVVNNSNGTLPTQLSNGDGTTASDTSVSFRPNSTTTNPVETARLGIFRTATGATISWGTTSSGIAINDASGTSTAPTITTGTPASTVSTTNVNINGAIVVLGWKCNNTNTGLDASGKSPRAISVLFVSESAGGNGSLQCQG